VKICGEISPLHFTYKEEGDALDEKELKEYTTQGPIIDYMVWPILLLYKDGPIVSKGAAQAKPPSDKKT
jgi:hypothetical protein